MMKPARPHLAVLKQICDLIPGHLAWEAASARGVQTQELVGRRQSLRSIAIKFRREIALLVHLLFGAAAFVLAFVIRFDGQFGGLDLDLMLATLPLALILKTFAIVHYGLHRGLLRYVSVDDLARIIKASMAGTVAFGFLELILFGHGFPRSVLILDGIVTVMLYGGVRFGLRLLGEAWSPAMVERRGRHTLIVGAGDTGEMALRLLSQNLRDPSTVVGFLDDDPTKMGMTIHGLNVLGSTMDAPRVIRDYGVTEVLIAIPSVGKAVVRRIVESGSVHNAAFKILPSIETPRIRNLEVDDLLGREPISLDSAPVRAGNAGRRILVTGAGGSIGSELCRQIAQTAPAELIILDVAETPLFDIEQELASRFPDLRKTAVICDLRNADDVERTLVRHKPHVVLHAAAYKHVPLMESHPTRAVLNNIAGTRTLAEAAVRHAVERFLLISTDKAVQPVSVMGATKRCAELLLNQLGGKGTAFRAVRFGNVLGSNGSVVPIFKRQIAQGGPITVTHPEATRYFMTIPEAAELVLQADALGRDGDLFMLDMGDPVMISDLARNMIRLSGLVVGQDIELTYTGLRPGERLHEQLAYSREAATPTSVPKLFLYRCPTGPDQALLGRLDVLCSTARGGDEAKTVEYLWEIVKNGNRVAA